MSRDTIIIINLQCEIRSIYQIPRDGRLLNCIFREREGNIKTPLLNHPERAGNVIRA